METIKIKDGDKVRYKNNAGVIFKDKYTVVSIENGTAELKASGCSTLIHLPLSKLVLV